MIGLIGCYKGFNTEGGAEGVGKATTARSWFRACSSLSSIISSLPCYGDAMAMIEIIDLHKNFGSLQVLRGVNLSVEKGESMTVIGGSGSGKSVLLKHIIGLLFPDKGRVLVDGQVLNNLDAFGLNEVRKKFGMLFQGAALFDSLTVWENVGFGSNSIRSCPTRRSAVSQPRSLRSSVSRTLRTRCRRTSREA